MTTSSWFRAKRAGLALACAMALCISFAQATAAAIADTEIRIEGQGGVTLIGHPSEHSIELRIPGRPSLLIGEAQITVTRSRVTMVARDAKHTIVGYSDRRTAGGRIGVLTRIPGYDYSRPDQKPRLRPLAEQWNAARVTVTNEKSRLAAVSR